MEEFRNSFGEEIYSQMVAERIRQRKRVGWSLLPSEQSFLDEHPELAAGLEELHHHWQLNF